MKAETVDLLALFEKDVRYLIPIFQRNYKWNRNEHWTPFWVDVRNVAEDILEFGEGPDLGEHFLGAVVCEPQLSYGRDALAVSIIDGQQRLTTLQLLLAGARNVCASRSFADLDYLNPLIENKPAVVKDRPAHRFKIWPNVADRPGLQAALSDPSGGTSPELAVRYFSDAIDEWLDRGDVDDPLDDEDYSPEERMGALITAITRHLKVVKIDLETNDNAQMIFETLNARGERLTDADLIRNELFRRADAEGLDVEALHNAYWKPFDEQRWSARIAHGRHQRERIHMYVNHWLSMRVLEEIPAAAIFREFKAYISRTGAGAEPIAKDLFVNGVVFDSFDRFEPDSREWWFFRRINEMDLITVLPVLLWLFGQGEAVPITNRHRALLAIESWLVRRLLGRDTTRGYGSLFIELLKTAAGSGPAADADARIIKLLAGRTADVDRWPTDDVFRSTVINTNVYKLKQSRLKMVLEALETKLCEGGRAEKITLGHNLWIEHLLPQTWSTVPEWALPPTDDPTAAALQRDHLLHTLGNLTLTTAKLDIELSNRPWADKVKRLQASVLQLNSRIAADYPGGWDETTIKERGNKLTDLMVQIWPGPQALLASVADRA